MQYYTNWLKNKIRYLIAVCSKTVFVVPENVKILTPRKYWDDTYIRCYDVAAAILYAKHPVFVDTEHFDRIESWCIQNIPNRFAFLKSTNKNRLEKIVFYDKNALLMFKLWWSP